MARLKGTHALSDDDFCLAVNTLALQQLFDTSKVLSEQFVSSLQDGDDFAIAEARLKDLTAIFGKLIRRFVLLRDEDVKQFYRNLVEEVMRLGYFKK